MLQKPVIAFFTLHLSIFKFLPRKQNFQNDFSYNKVFKIIIYFYI